MSGPETLEAAFWRLLREGFTVVEIGSHPDYIAAWERERGPYPTRRGDAQ